MLQIAHAAQCVKSQFLVENATFFSNFKTLCFTSKIKFTLFFSNYLATFNLMFIFKREHRIALLQIYIFLLLLSPFVNFVEFSMFCPIFVQFFNFRSILSNFSVFVQFTIFVQFFNFCPIFSSVDFSNFCPIFNFML